MSQDLIDRIAADCSLARVDAAALAAFAAAPGAGVAFFAGDPAQMPESADAAVALRELLAMAGPGLRACLVDRAHEKAAMAANGVLVLPCLVFFRDGRAAGTISRIADWSVYRDKLAELGLVRRAA